jgi:hypothetical protein
VAAGHLSLGCAESLQLTEAAPASGSSLSFWPPPRSTSIWTDPVRPSTRLSLRESAERVQASLKHAGYTDERWFAIGTQFDHGFAVTTRLEHMNDDGTSGAARWSSLFQEAPTLLWLDRARTMRLAAAGRYRVFLVALTDLPIGRTDRAPVWDEQTCMTEALAASSREAFATRMVSPSYRIGVYVYAYRSDDGDGELIPSEPAFPAARHVEMAGLSALDRSVTTE